MEHLLKDGEEFASFITAVAERELGVQHDVRATLDELTMRIGYDHFHSGLTGRDITDTATQWQVLESDRWLGSRARSVFHDLRALVIRTHLIPAEARTHNQPAQISTLGRKFAMHLEQLSAAIWRLQRTRAEYSIRAVSGTVGNGAELEELGILNRFAMTKLLYNALGVPIAQDQRMCITQGQIYPREEDRAWVDGLIGIGAALSNFAHTVRLLAGRGVAWEGYADQRIGSSSMPHKRNPSRSERICGLYSVLCGFGDMLSHVAGSQWEEGDVSCSVVQRVALSGASFALDAMLQSAHDVIVGLGWNESVTGEELCEREPGLVSSLAVAVLVKGGIPQALAYENIKKDNRMGDELRNQLSARAIRKAAEIVMTVANREEGDQYRIDENPHYHLNPKWEAVR
jgi:adenylosuccinate lyase